MSAVRSMLKAFASLEDAKIRSLVTTAHVMMASVVTRVQRKVTPTQKVLSYYV